MKKLLLVCLTAALLLALSLSLVSCTVYEMDVPLANTYIAEFIYAIEIEDYDEAKLYLHPDYDDVNIAANMEKVPDNYKGVSYDIYEDSSAYSTYMEQGTGGATYRKLYHRLFGNRDVWISLTVLYDGNGFGIMDFKIDPVE